MNENQYRVIKTIVTECSRGGAMHCYDSRGHSIGTYDDIANEFVHSMEKKGYMLDDVKMFIMKEDKCLAQLIFLRCSDE